MSVQGHRFQVNAHRTSLLLAVFLGLFLFQPSHAATTSLVADVVTGSLDSNPEYLTDVNGVLYFAAYESATGSELWRLNDTSAVRVSDMNPGAGDAEPKWLANVGGVLYFSATNGSSGRELWQLGPSGTPTQVADLNPGASSSDPSFLTNVNGVLYFVASTPATGSELWRLVGGAPQLVGEVFPSAGSADPRWLAAVDGVLYFSATNGTSGYELWTLDASGQPQQVADINPGPVSANPNALAAMDGVLYFAATNGTSGYELWKLDASGQPQQVADINPGPASANPYALTPVNDVLFFAANDGVHGTEIWKLNASQTTPQFAADINPKGSSAPYSMVAADGMLFLSANDPTYGTELWRLYTSGGAAHLVADMLPGSGSSSPRWLTVTNGTLYYAAGDGVKGRELWKLIFTSEPTITGNAQPIDQGDTDPDSLDGTMYGRVPVGEQVSRTFSLQNTGDAPLNLGSAAVSLTGAQAGNFTVIRQPAALLQPGESTTFTIALLPTTVGLVSATVQVANDAGAGPYTFTIQGEGYIPPPTVSVSASPLFVEEASHMPITYTFTRTGDTSNPLTVSYTVGGTATHQQDYTSTFASAGVNSLIIPAGQTSVSVEATPVNDDLLDGSETVVVDVTPSSAYDRGNPASATGTIVGPAPAPVYSVALPAISIPAPMQVLAVLNPNTIPSRRATLGETFYTARVAVSIPAGSSGNYYLSSSRTTLAPVLVDDELRIRLNGQEVFRQVFVSGKSLAPTIVPMPRTLVEQMNGKTITIEFRDVYGFQVSARPVYLVRGP